MGGITLSWKGNWVFREKKMSNWVIYGKIVKKKKLGSSRTNKNPTSFQTGEQIYKADKETFSHHWVHYLFVLSILL